MVLEKYDLNGITLTIFWNFHETKGLAKNLKKQLSHLKVLFCTSDNFIENNAIICKYNINADLKIVVIKFYDYLKRGVTNI